jgi:hypothetical protein
VTGYDSGSDGHSLTPRRKRRPVTRPVGNVITVGLTMP